VAEHEGHDSDAIHGGVFEVFKTLCRTQMDVLKEELQDHERRIRFLERTVAIAGGACGVGIFIIKVILKQ